MNVDDFEVTGDPDDQTVPWWGLRLVAVKRKDNELLTFVDSIENDRHVMRSFLDVPFDRVMFTGCSINGRFHAV